MNKSKVLVAFLSFLMYSTFSYAQITKSNLLDQNEYICSYNTFEGVDLIATFNNSSNLIKIYNLEFTLIKTIPYQITKEISTVHISGLSKDVFNSDPKIEFLIQSISIKGIMNFELINEDNNVIHDFNTNIVSIRTIGRKNYLVEMIYDSQTYGTNNQIKTNLTTALYEINGKFRPTLLTH